MVKLSVLHAPLHTLRTDVVAIPCSEEDLQRQIAALKDRVRDLPAQITRGVFKGKDGQTLFLVPHRMRALHLLLVGTGKRRTLSAEKLRRTAGTAVKSANSVRATSLTILLPDRATLHDGQWDETRGAEAGQACAEGAILANYRFDKYITSANEKLTLRSVQIAVASAQELPQVRRGIRTATVVGSAVILARNLTNAPANEITPDTLARQTRIEGRQAGFKVTVFGRKEIRRLGMGGLTGVSQGSAAPPRFIILQYNPGGRGRGTVVLVGKGVTFDSGGISIKPSAGMAEMKMDMAGAAAVIGTMSAAARLNVPFHLVGLIPATENLSGGSAMRPGDILRHYNGKTSEVDNTDAEGRLILADALGYAARFSPDLVIDLATLTGAVVVALGHFAAGMLGNDQQTMDLLATAGRRTYERVWQLPMFEEYEPLVKSDIADVKNVGGRWAGAITGAMFLRKFVGKHRWVHLDIAGTAMLEEATAYAHKGGSGFGVRLLVEFLTKWRKPGPWREQPE